MELDTVFGLPAHPLLVHIPVVLIPITALLALAAIVLVKARRWLVVAALVTGLGASVGTYLVQQSGEPLEERVEDTRGETHLLEEHTEQGESLLPFVIVLAVIAGAAVAIDFSGKSKQLATAALALTLVAGGAATWKVAEVGHSGAKAAWEDVETASGD